jgi:hypothetical protein
MTGFSQALPLPSAQINEISVRFLLVSSVGKTAVFVYSIWQRWPITELTLRCIQEQLPAYTSDSVRSSDFGFPKSFKFLDLEVYFDWSGFP